ncbi:YVTN family beta-propeller protein [Thiohalophilus thiocyanatoxydans]|uniref:YVTN family beta-propeller protein n=2 Tax=Thiohalophilus thiocyanatoxydans TaxID=381308 RepID=A0A4R8IXD4_9GAMM|nr:YVTN family beta-propeller protein [Thiohalophilus thiocyanatoxydans]
MRNRIDRIAIAALLTVYSGWLLAAPQVYIPLGTGNQVIQVDAKTDRITASYSGVENAHGLVATPDGEYLIAGSLNETALKPDQPEDAPNSQLYLIHPVHGHVMSTIPVAGWTHHQAITPDGRYVLSTHGMRGYVSVVDLQENKVIKTIETGNVPNYAVVTTEGHRAYVSNTASNNIVEIDLGSWKVLRTLESGPGPEHLVFSGDQKTLYVTNPRAGKVSVVSIQSGEVVNEYSLGGDVHGLDIGDDGNILFVSSKKDNKLFAVDIRDGSKQSITLSPAPYHLNTITGTGKVYVSSRKKPIIWVVDQASLKVTNEIELPAGEGHQMAIVE